MLSAPGNALHENGTIRGSAAPARFRLLPALLCAALLLSASCGSGGSSGDSAGTGSVSFSLSLPGQSGTTTKEASFSCWDYGISSVEAYVYDEDGNLLAQGGPWGCDDGAGTVSGVKEGTNRRIVIACLNVSGNMNYSGEVGEVEVIRNSTTDVGTIGIGPVGSNNPPVLGSIEVGTALYPTTYSFTLDSDSATDPDGDSFTFDVGNLPEGATFDQSTGLFTWSPPGTGDYPMLFRVTDNGSPRLTDYQEVVFHVINMTNGNASAPVLALDPSGPQRTTAGGLISIALSATDDNGDGYSYSIGTVPGRTNVPSSAGITGGDVKVFQWDTTDVAADNYYVRLIVTDDSPSALTDYEDVTVTVGRVNRPPVLTPIWARKAVIASSTEATVSFYVTATDPDSDSLTYSLESAGTDTIYPAGAAISSQRFTWTPAAAGTYRVRIRVRDNGSPQESDFEDVTITVYDYR